MGAGGRVDRGVVLAAALVPPEALWDGEGERLDALDEAWLDAEASGGCVARSAAHAVRIAFPDAAAALAWAERAFPRVAALGWGTLRGALISGAPQRRRDPITGAVDLVGADVRRAAALAEGAVPGELRLDDAAAREAPQHRVRAGPSGWAVHLGPGDATELRLPPDEGPLLGREPELRAALAALDAGRAVAVVGPGGAGKTRLALRAAWRWHARTAAPAAWAGLAAARDRSEVLAIVADAIGVDIGGRGGDRAALDRIVAALGARGEALVVLDNAEQVLGPVGELLARAPEVRWLVTSRVRLDAEEIALGGLPAEDAVALLTRGVPPARWTEADRAAAFELIERLDRLPLALELAAAHLDLLRPAQVIAHLAELSDPARPARHASLSAAIGWSVGLLEPRVHDVLVQLGAFRGGFDVEDAERVVSAEGPAWTALRALLDASLLRRDAARLTLYEQVREHARGLLDADPRRDEVLARHARWATREVDGWYDQRTGTLQPARLARLRRERADVLAVLDRGGRSAAVAASALDVLADVASPLDVHLGWLDRGVDAADADGDPALRARLRWLRAAARRRAGRGDAGTDLEQALVLADHAVDGGLRARVLLQQAVLAVLGGDLDRAERLSGEVVALARAAGARVAEGRALALLARLATERERLDEAAARYAEAIRCLEAAEDHLGLGLALLERVGLASAQGRHDAVEQDLDAAEAALRTVGHLRSLEYVLDARLSRSLHRGDEADVVQRALAEIERARRRGEPTREATGLTRLGAALLVFGRLERAEATLVDARAAAASTGLAYLVPTCELLCAAIAVERGDLDLARTRLAQVGPESAGDARLWLAVIDALQGDPGPSEIALAEAPGGAVRALLEAARLRPGDAAAARAVEARLIREPPSRSHADLVSAGRVALTLARRVAGRGGLEVAPDAATIKLPDGGTIDLARRVTLKRVAAHLVDRRLERPGEAVPLDRVLAAGWPGERILPQAAANRVYVAMATLRKLGLAEVLLTRDDGYLLDPEVPVARCAVQPDTT
jgi:hypothetical protein